MSLAIFVADASFNVADRCIDWPFFPQTYLTNLIKSCNNIIVVVAVSCTLFCMWTILETFFLGLIDLHWDVKFAFNFIRTSHFEKHYVEFDDTFCLLTGFKKFNYTRQRLQFKHKLIPGFSRTFLRKWPFMYWHKRHKRSSNELSTRWAWPIELNSIRFDRNQTELNRSDSNRTKPWDWRFFSDLHFLSSFSDLQIS